MDKITIPCNDNNKENSKDINIKIMLIDALQQNFRNENTMRYLKDNINVSYLLNIILIIM
jgi:hypothetical protein